MRGKGSKSKKAIPTDRQVGLRLRQERERLGMTQAELSAIGGVKPLTQYLYERGDRTPQFDYILRVVRAGVDLSFLVNGVRGRTMEGDVVLKDGVFAELYRLVATYGVTPEGKRLSDEERIAIFASLFVAVSGRSREEIDWEAIKAWPSGYPKQSGRKTG